MVKNRLGGRRNGKLWSILVLTLVLECMIVLSGEIISDISVEMLSKSRVLLIMEMEE